MFTGLIETTARLDRVEPGPGNHVFHVATGLAADLTPGDSIAVNGVCLTVVSSTAAAFIADVSPETLRVTSLGSMRAGRRLNLERPLRADARLGGHFVLGHVDACGRIVAVRPDGGSHWLDVSVPAELLPLVILKGSIAIDGISLTVATLSDDRVGVQIVPFTWTHTTLSESREGDLVNLEADVIGKYVARLHDAGRPAALAAGRQEIS